MTQQMCKTHGLMIHDYCLFYNATSVDALLYSTTLQQKYIFQNILLFTFLSTLCAETYSNCNSVQMFISLGMGKWKIELFILLISSIVKKDLTISTK